MNEELASKLLRAVKDCRNAIRSGALIEDHRGKVYEQQFGQAFLNMLENLIKESENK